jgi:rhamnopyranosyl-N-acetylglucosaminyl-diphospho-decaprenol beta-1,3/1,4-galactofuranosyltransferase
MENKKIACIVVTFNREELLLKCLESILFQTLKVDIIYIIDNCSNELTYKLLFQNEFISKIPDFNKKENQTIVNEIIIDEAKKKSVIIKYTRKFENDGGAGGFFEGMKQAFNDNCDWLWMMDDDGIAEKNQLKNLTEYSVINNIDFANALVLDIEDTKNLAFGLNESIQNVDQLNGKLEIKNFINPFNGTLISRKLISNIGFVKREMFIWGDETEYFWRAKKYGANISTITNAIHFHPKIKGEYDYIFPKYLKGKVMLKPINRRHIYFTNLAYSIWRYKSTKEYFTFLIKYTLYFIKENQITELTKFIGSNIKGIKGDFSKNKN